MSDDARGWRVALVPDLLVNPQESFGAVYSDALRALESNGYGLLQLPPGGTHTLLLAVIADQIAEYAHHGYAVVAIGVVGEEGAALHWRRLVPLLKHRGIGLPPRHCLRPAADRAIEAQRLESFLSGYDLPLDEQRHWRV